MAPKTRTVVTFVSAAFNTTEAKNYFINECCFGDDLAEWLIQELRKDAIETDEKPGQEDFGWYVNFAAGGIGHTFVIGYRPEGERETGTWIGWLERRRGFIGSILDGRKRGIQASSAEEIHRVLARSPVIRDCAGTSNATSTPDVKKVAHRRRLHQRSWLTGLLLRQVIARTWRIRDYASSVPRASQLCRK